MLLDIVLLHIAPDPLQLSHGQRQQIGAALSAVGTFSIDAVVGVKVLHGCVGYFAVPAHQTHHAFFTSASVKSDSLARFPLMYRI